MHATWVSLIELVNVASAVVATVGAGVGYLQIAKRRFWWPFNPRLPVPLRSELKRLLSETKRLNPSTHIEITFQELQGERVWLGIVYRQSMTNISKTGLPLRCRFSSNGRPHRNLSVRLDNHVVTPFVETESEIVVSSHLDPQQTRYLEMRYEMAYHASDSELFVSYRAGDQYHFSVIDAVSEAAGRRSFVLEIDPMFSPARIERLDIESVGGHPFSRQLSVAGGYSPFSGVYLKWRRVN